MSVTVKKKTEPARYECDLCGAHRRKQYMVMVENGTYCANVDGCDRRRRERGWL
jgi:hypothetical protein